MFPNFKSHIIEHRHKWLKISLGVFIALFLIITVCFALALGYLKLYEERVYPGVYVGNYHLGGMDSNQIISFVESFNNRLVKEGIVFVYEDRQGISSEVKLPIVNVVGSEGSSIEIAKINAQSLALSALRVSRPVGFFSAITDPLKTRFVEKIIITAKIDYTNELTPGIATAFAPFSDNPSDANLIMNSPAPTDYKIIPEQSGVTFDLGKARTDLISNLSSLSLSSIKVEKQQYQPSLIESDAKETAKSLTEVLSYGNITLSYADTKTKIKREWVLTPQIYYEWIGVRKNQSNQAILTFEEQKVKKYFDLVKIYTDQPAKDAKFEVIDGKVNKFQASQSGIGLDEDRTYSDLRAAFEERNFKPTEVTKTVNVSVNIVEPKVQMGDANDLGIKEVIGVGMSTFRDSHTNRIKNIANAVKRLNGTLIRPDEIFSTNNYAGPYILENGYLPEEVIKGNKIKKEVGGGMCQIGTTMFRMAMNSGMPIIERRNHSLVVNYYADPVNGNPGTDATVYDPIVDFKFHNDTGSYALLQTDINYDKQELTFTLWGTNDGRKGSYTHPIVSKWIPAGETQEVKTITLAEGKKTCQNAFRGAIASFIYTRFTSTSEKIDRVFESYYRPLPKMCMVGVSLNEYCLENPTDSECESLSTLDEGTSTTSSTF
ncbi:MAG: VanW family protein [bacterium]